MIKGKSVWQWICLLGVVGVGFYFLHDLVGGILYPGYNWLTYFAGFLVAEDAPAQAAMVSGTLLAISRILAIVSLIAVCVVLRRRFGEVLYTGVIIYSIFRIVSAITLVHYPLSDTDEGPVIMRGFLTVGILIPLSIIYIILLFKERLGKLAVVCLIAQIAALLSLVLSALTAGLAHCFPESSLPFMLLINCAGFLTTFSGLFERIFLYGCVILGAALAIYGYNAEE